MTQVAFQPTGMANAPSLIKVSTLAGQTLEVQGAMEAAFYQQQQQKYRDQNAFTDASDLQDLDRLLFAELMVFRAQAWLAKGQNYHGENLSPSEEADCRRTIKETSPLISQIKNDLGLTKSQREKDKFESVGRYVADLKARAREHGVKREKELERALVLINELSALIGAFDRADEPEREKLGFKTEADVLDWVRTTMLPEFREVDAYFRQNQQRFWIRTI